MIPDVVKADSTHEGPPCEVGGVVFHPPYFGATPNTSSYYDLSHIEDVGEWRFRLDASASLAIEFLSEGGIVCAIGRRYRYGGEEIRFDEWLVEAFCSALEIQEVWISEPDVIIVMKRRK
jgi:hypothetical protein